MTTPYYNAGSTGGPVVVQGHAVSGNQVPIIQGTATAVDSHYHQNLLQGGNFSGAADTQQQQQQHPWTKGERQPRQCRDMIWGLLFYVHLFSIAVAILAASRAKPVYRFYEDRMPEWIWDKNVYISRDTAADESSAASRLSLIAQMTEDVAMRQFSEVSNRPNRAYAPPSCQSRSICLSA